MSAPSPSTALSGFLRGLAPRARVLLQAQAGPALDAEATLAELHRAFAAEAARWPLAEWPQRYWSRLLALPVLTESPESVPDHPLYHLAPTRRLAMVLRLVAGLEPAGAARLMGVSETAYRAMVTDAEDRLEALGVDTRTLMRWQAGFQQQIRDAATLPLPPLALARGASPSRRFHWGPLQRGLGAVAGLLVVALVATWIWPPGSPPGTAGSTAAGPASLPAEAPAVDPDALLTDPDLWLLLDPDRPLWLADVAWWSWLSHQPGVPAQTTGAASAAPGAPPPWSDLDAATRAVLAPAEALWPGLPVETRADLLAQARHWQGLDAGAREALRQRWQAELARQPADRAAERARYSAWRSLPPAEQARLRTLAVAWSMVAPEIRDASASAFAALPVAEQAGWRFGPRLGPDMPVLADLLEFVPVNERAGLLALLRDLPDERRHALATRLAELPPAARLPWRDRLLAAEPSQRSVVLAQLIDGTSRTPGP